MNRNLLYISSHLTKWKTLYSFTFRYLKVQFPCLGGCDVTGGISDVILVSRRDCSCKCLMNDEALCSVLDISWAARSGKGFFKNRQFSIRARWKPSGAHGWEGGYHIHISVGLLPANTHAYSHVLSFICCLKYIFLLLSFIACCSLPTLILLWEPTGYSIAFYWTFIPFGRWIRPLLTPTQSLRLSASHKTQP